MKKWVRDRTLRRVRKLDYSFSKPLTTVESLAHRRKFITSYGDPSEKVRKSKLMSLRPANNKVAKSAHDQIQAMSFAKHWDLRDS